MLQRSIVRTQRLVGHGQVTVRGSLRGPIVHLQGPQLGSVFPPPAPRASAAPANGGATHLQGDLQLLPVVAHGLVVDAERVVGVAHVPVRPPLGGVIAQFLREGQVRLVELERCFVLCLHLVDDAWEGDQEGEERPVRTKAVNSPPIFTASFKFAPRQPGWR